MTETRRAKDMKFTRKNDRFSGGRQKRILRVGGLAAATVLSAQAAFGGLTLFERDGLRLDMEVHTVGRFQSFTQKANDREEAGFERDRMSTGFQHAMGNIGWRLSMEDYVEVFFDATMASRVAADKWWGHQGYLLIRQLPEDSPVAGANVLLNHIDVKAGQFVVDFGNELKRRTYNADAQGNPLVGNPIVSPHATEVGVEVHYAHPAGSFGAMLGSGSGVATENFDDDTRLSYRGKIWAGGPALAGIEAAASYYRASHGDSVGRGANLFRTDRLGGQYAGIWDDGNAPGQVTIGDGTDVTAWQIDAGWNASEIGGLWCHWGRVEDDNRDTDEVWNYYGVTGQFYIMPEAVYLAARYSEADAQRFSGMNSNNGRINRWQVGGGVHLFQGALLKLEYVEQRASGFSEGTISGIELNQSPRFSGVIAEMSYSF